MSSSSEQDMSESSNSPASYTTVESPHSSPPQQVPQLTTTLNLSLHNNLYKTKKGNIPFLRITEQPQSYFRFRYDTEKSGSTHGSILGKSYADSNCKKKIKKTHPTVELINFEREAEIRCSIKYENDKRPLKTYYEILEGTQNVKNCLVPQKKSYRVGFPGVGVHTITQVKLAELLYNKLLEGPQRNPVNTTNLRDHCNELSKKIDQNIVRLKFSAYDVQSKEEICDPVLSDPIYNKKSAATNALKIFRTSLCSGRPCGGDDVFLIVDKIEKHKIGVRFYEEDQNKKRVWSAWGVFLPTDVYHQCVIVCKTPPYKDPKTPGNVKVWIELVRTSTGETCLEPHEFIYRADPVYKQQLLYKRRKLATPRAARPETHFSGASLNYDLPVIVVPNDVTEFQAENQPPPQPAVEQSFENQWNILSSTQHVLEDGSGQTLAEITFPPSPMWGASQLTSQPLGNAAVSHPAGICFPAPSALMSTGTDIATLPVTSDASNMDIAAPSALLTMSDPGSAAPPPPPDFGIAEAATFQLSTEHLLSSEVEVEDESLTRFLEDNLTEYANIFDMSFDDLFSTDTENKPLVGDSGRVKVPESEPSAAETGAERPEDDPPHFEMAGALWVPADTGTTPPSHTETLPTTGMTEHLNYGPSQSAPIPQAIDANFITHESDRRLAREIKTRYQGQDPTKLASAMETSASSDITPQGPISISLPMEPIEDDNDVIEGQMDTEGIIVTHEHLLATMKNKKPNWIRMNCAARNVENLQATSSDNEELHCKVEILNVERVKEAVKLLLHTVATGVIDCITNNSSNLPDSDVKSVDMSHDNEVSGTGDKDDNGKGEMRIDEETGGIPVVTASGTITPGAGKNSARACKYADESNKTAAENAEARSGAGFPAWFTAEDSVEVRKLVSELYNIIRDKKSSRSEVAAKLRRLIDIRLPNGDTFLHMTLYRSQRSFEALVKMIASAKMVHLLNCVNDRGETVLHLAVVQGAPELVALLLAKGCDPNVCNCDGETALHYVVRYAGADMLRVLLDAASRARCTLQLDALNAERQSALHLCALHGRARCAALLARAGASCGARDAAGRTPLHLCAYDARVEVARALLPLVGAHVHARDGGGRTALEVVCARAPAPGVEELARALLAAGAHADPAWRAAHAHSALRALLAPHVTRDLLDADEPEDDDFVSESDDSDEYESADDDLIEGPSAESLARDIGQLNIEE